MSSVSNKVETKKNGTTKFWYRLLYNSTRIIECVVFLKLKWRLYEEKLQIKEHDYKISHDILVSSPFYNIECHTVFNYHYSLFY